MPRIATSRGLIAKFLSLALMACAPAATLRASDTLAGASPDQLWRKGIELVGKGEFSKAAETLRGIPSGGPLTDRVRTWLDEFEAMQAARHAQDQVEFDRYVKYAKERWDRKEFAKALDQTLLAADVAMNRDEFLRTDWVSKLVNDSLEAAERYRKDQKWRKAWHIYADLGALFDREPRYPKLESEMLTHLRLEVMFKEDKNWRERIDKVRWDDARAALECIQHYYVEPADFKKIAERGLEQLLLLAESQAARDALEGLKDDNNRRDFVARVQVKLDQVHNAPSLDWKETAEVFNRAVRDINNSTVKLPEELLVSEVMRGALEPLDDFTTVIWPAESDEFDKHTRGDFIGVGISIIKNRVSDEIEVVSPLEDTPAYRAGIQAGDIITHVDGKDIKGYSLNKVVDTITGPKDSSVSLSVRRDDKTIEFPLKRALVKIQSVKGLRRDGTKEEKWDHWLDKENGIAYIRVTNFQRNTVEDVANVLSELQTKGLRSLVMDLRGNPGGLLDSAWRMSSLFLERGENVVSTRGRDPAENQKLDAQGDGPWTDLPVVVLVDENSASASEIVAGSIQDTKHGTVLGARTYGKFSVQNLIQLSRSNAKLKITTAKYYLPSGRSLHREITSDTWGVEPDVPVRMVRWERVNMWQLRREADRLGPPKPGKSDDDLAFAGDDEEEDKVVPIVDPEGEKKDDAAEQAKADAEKKADHDEEDAEIANLPKIEQPDENDRPKTDPQLDAALVMMRVKLLGDAHPTLATADKVDPNTARK